MEPGTQSSTHCMVVAYPGGPEGCFSGEDAVFFPEHCRVQMLEIPPHCLASSPSESKI